MAVCWPVSGRCRVSKVHEQLSRWLERELGWHAVEFAGALSGGNSNQTWLFSAGDNRCVVRTPPAESISPTSARGIERESKALSVAHGAVRAPQLLAWCGDNSVIGRPFLVQQYIDGVAITDTLPAAYGDPVESANLLGKDLIAQLAAVHSIEWPAAGLETLGRPDGFVERQIHRWTKVRAEHATRALPQLFELSDWLLKNRPAAQRPALIHGDYHLDNTLADRHQPRINAIIDWELATVGEPAMDVALALLFWGKQRSSVPPAFSHLQAISRLDGVVDRRALAEHWSELTGRSLANMDYYMALASWRLAAIIEGAYGLYCHGKSSTDYAAGLEYDVPALLEEALCATRGDW